MGTVATMLVLMGILAMTLIGLAGNSGLQGYSGLIGTANNALQASSARSRSSAAFNAAESGIQYAVAWLSAQSQPPALTSAFAPSLWGATLTNTRATIMPDATDPNTSFSVRIYPDSYNNDVTSPTSTQKKYLIESVGVSNGVTAIVQAYVEQKSLSQYLVLLNSWNNSGNYWVSGLTTFDGPVHDNNMGGDGKTNPPDGTAENILWKSAAGTQPMFIYTGSDAYTVSSPTGISWWKDQFNTSGTPQVVTNADGSQTNQWLNVAAGGADTVHTGTPVVPFPTTSNQQESAAIGTASTLNTTGVTLCPSGGIYIEGNVDEMALSATGTNNTTQVITVTQGTTVQRVTINPTLNTTVVETKQPDGSWLSTATQTGTTNGVVYCNGNIGVQGDPKTGGVHGQVADNLLDASGNLAHNNALTITTPHTANCNVDGSVTYNTARQVSKDASGNPIYIDVNGNRTSDSTKGTPVYVSEDKDPNFTGHAGTLGLISNNVLVTKNDSSGNALTKFEMDGTVLASGLYDADHWGDRPVGLWENMGGYLSSTVGTFGVFNSSTLQLVNGFNTQFNYDARMRNNPPPFFPTTGNQYNIISWQQVQATLE